MKKTKIALLGIIAAAALCFTGCGLVAKNTLPPVNTTNGVGVVTSSSPPPVYVVNGAALSNLTGTVNSYLPLAQGALAATPLAPAAPFLPTATNALLGLLATGLGLYAGYKNNQASAANASADNHAAAAAALASVITPGSAQAAQAVANAAINGSAQLVSEHISNAAKPV